MMPMPWKGPVIHESIACWFVAVVLPETMTLPFAPASAPFSVYHGFEESS